MAEAVLFNLANGILESLGSFAYQKIRLLDDAKDELQSLEDTVRAIQVVLLDAEKQQWHNNQVKLWLQNLKDVLYDVHDLFDDVAIEDLRRNVISSNKMSKTVRIFFSKSNQLTHRLEVTNKIRELTKELRRIRKDRTFHLEERRSEETAATGRGKKRELPSLDENIIGREEEKKKIKQLLFDSSSRQSVSFVALVGKGGLGKTALARLVYSDREVRGHFELRMWACVSDFSDLNSIIKEILRSEIDNREGRDENEKKELRQALENKTLEQLAKSLHEIIKGKKYLLVLDDLWNEERRNWLTFGEWLVGGERGSKVLVTTRSHTVAKVMDAKSVIHDLHGLPQDESWNLFRKMAFGDGVEPSDPELERMAQDMAKKCAGVPLAIRTIGCLLYSRKEDEWLHYAGPKLPEIQEIDKDDDGILQVLKFSYDHLPSCLKHCFAYCSLFPKDYIYQKWIIIPLWVAQGFIESDRGKDNLEEVADRYLTELLCRSFLDVAVKSCDGEVLSFKMHDLMHDLAQKVAGGECKVINLEKGDYDGRIRHASIFSEILPRNKMISVLKKSKLRTFVCSGSADFLTPSESEPSVLNSREVFSQLRDCRALVLFNKYFPLPPPSFEKLKYLRFLLIAGNQSIESLPNSIMDLVNLHVLKLVECEKLRTFLRDLKGLINLRYLLIRSCPSLSHLPPLSELPSLRTLILAHLYALESVQQPSDVGQSAPPFFPSLERLELHSCLKLRVIGLSQTHHRSDNSQSSFPKLRHVEITGCHGLNFVPPFPQVEYLKIGGGKMLEEQLMANPNSEGSTFNLPLSNLKRLHLSEVYLEPLMLERLLRLASHLEYMSFSFCGDLMGLSHGMQHFSSLQELDITGCWGIDFSCQENEHGIVAQFLPKLRVLKMSLSSDLVALPEWIQHVTTLQHLEISRWKHLKSLPTWIENLSLLEKLVISDCERLVQWPFEMLRNLTCFCLKEIRIHRCPALKSCLTNGPEDWPVIAWEDESEYEQ